MQASPTGLIRKGLLSKKKSTWRLMKRLFQLIGFIILSSHVFGQDSTTVTSEHATKFLFNGYIKDLQTLRTDKDFSDWDATNMVHNRLNLKWLISDNLTATAELRTRLFSGDDVKQVPAFAQSLRNVNELINIQRYWKLSSSMVLHSNFERLNIDYQNKNLNVRIGRQRINWGITTTWNPNDIFNAYNFLDFDYEERAGIDGARASYIINNSSNIEIAYANTGRKQGNIAAFKYSVNRGNYDIQFIGGIFKNHLSLGTGWAGYVGDAGFKGEIQYFAANQHSKGLLNILLESDYMFNNGWYISLGTLFNSNGLSKPVNDWTNINLNLSPENLMPTKWNLILSTIKEINPLMSANISLLYAPGNKMAIIYPSIQYSLATNLDLSIVWQSYFSELNNNYEAVNHQGILRMKLNF